MNRLIKFAQSMPTVAKIGIMIFVTLFTIGSVVVFLSMQTLQEYSQKIINDMVHTNLETNQNFLSNTILAHDNWALFLFVQSLTKNKFIKEAGIIDTHNFILAFSNPTIYRVGDFLKDNEKFTILPIKKDNITLGYACLRVKKVTILEYFKNSMKKNILIFLAVIFISLFLSLYLVKNLLSRLKVLHNNALSIANKEWNKIVLFEPRQNDEIDNILSLISKIMIETKDALSQEQSLKDFYNNILSSLDLFIVICDRDKNIIYVKEHPLKKYILDKDNNFINITNLSCFFQSRCNSCQNRLHVQKDNTTLLIQSIMIDQHFIVTATDITKTSQLEEQLRISKSLREIGEISAIFAHEIKNILQPLLFLTHKGYQPDAEDLQIFQSSIYKIDQQVKDFLKLGKPIQKESHTATNVNKMISETIDFLQDKLSQKNISVNFIYDHTYYMSIDENSLEIVVMNLLTNSIEALDNNGVITVGLSKAEDSMCCLTYSDNGKGIPKKIMQDMFKPFQSTKKNGSGLGLYSIYRVTYLCGGYIHFEQNPYPTFKIYIPIAKEENEYCNN